MNNPAKVVRATLADCLQQGWLQPTRRPKLFEPYGRYRVTNPDYVESLRARAREALFDPDSVSQRDVCLAGLACAGGLLEELGKGAGMMQRQRMANELYKRDWVVEMVYQTLRAAAAAAAGASRGNT